MATLPDTVTIDRPTKGWHAEHGDITFPAGTYDVIDDVSNERGQGILLKVGIAELIVDPGEIWPEIDG